MVYERYADVEPIVVNPDRMMLEGHGLSIRESSEGRSPRVLFMPWTSIRFIRYEERENA